MNGKSCLIPIVNPFHIKADLQSVFISSTFLLLRFGQGNTSMAILPLQEEQLSVYGKLMCTKYW